MRGTRWLTGAFVVLSVLAATACTQPAAHSTGPAPTATSGSATTDAGGASTETPTPTVNAQPRAATEVDIRAGVNAATDFAAAQGLIARIAVIDRSDGEEVVSGRPADVPIFGASLAKVFMADNLLHRQRSGEFRLSAADRAQIEAMLTVSDDVAADALYTRFGGDAMIVEVAQRYGLPTVAPTNDPGEWELTTLSARDLARYYDQLLTDTPAPDRDYIVGLMRQAQEIAADGFHQFFGLPAALPGQTMGIKQGWMCCPRDTSYLHSTGILGSDNRYTVAILTENPGVFSPAFSTDVLTQIAALIFPPGTTLG